MFYVWLLRKRKKIEGNENEKSDHAFFFEIGEQKILPRLMFLRSI
jgi:hypothetical protein